MAIYHVQRFFQKTFMLMCEIRVAKVTPTFYTPRGYFGHPCAAF